MEFLITETIVKQYVVVAENEEAAQELWFNMDSEALALVLVNEEGINFDIVENEG